MEAGDLPESIAPAPSTVSLPITSTSSLPMTSTSSLPNTSTSSLPGISSSPGSLSQRSLKNHAIVEGVVCGLVLLVVVGAGVWIFLRKRAAAQVNAGAPMSEHAHRIPQLEPYVRILAFRPVSTLTNILRTHLALSHSLK